MANTYADEIKWWKNRAAEFDSKRAALRPVSFEHLAGAYRGSGNLNGAWTFDSSRIDKLENEYRSLVDRSSGIRDAYASVDWAAVKAKKSGTSGPTHPSVLAPSKDVLTAEKRNATLGNKIKDLGGQAFRKAVGGLVRVADILSRPGYAMRSAAAGYLDAYDDPNSAGGTDVTAWEGFRAFLNPVLDLSLGVPANIATGNDETYKNMWQGFSGKEKTSGHDLLKVIFPEFTSDHKKWTTALSFGVDVAYDPLSWLTVGQGSVVTGAAKAGSAGLVRATGRKALAESMLESTVWTKTGREAGKRALQEEVALRASRVENKAFKAANKEAIKADKNIRKLSKNKQFDKIDDAVVRAERAVEARKKAEATFEAARDANLAEDFTGFKLAQKAVFNRTLGLNAYAAYSKGVRSGGISNKAAVAYIKASNKLKAEAFTEMKSGANATEWVHIQRALKGKEITWGGTKSKSWVVPEDFDDFAKEFIDRIMPVKAVRELSKKQLSHRRGIMAAQQNDAEQFFNAFFKGQRGEDIQKMRKGVGFDPTPPKGASSKLAYAPKTTAAADTLAAALPKLDEVVDPVVVQQEAEDAVHAMIAAKAQNTPPDLSPADKAYQQSNGISDRAMALRQRGVSLSNEELAALTVIDTEFKNSINEGIALAQQPGGALSGVSSTMNDELGVLELQDWSAGLSDPTKIQYNRARNHAIAEIISGAWDDAVEKAALYERLTNPEVLVESMQGTVNHLLNQLHADVHLQVAQFLNMNHGLSMLPMAPYSLVHVGGLRGVIQRISDIPGFLKKGVSYKNARGDTSAVAGEDLIRSIQQKLELDIQATINFLTKTKEEMESGIPQGLGKSEFELQWRLDKDNLRQGDRFKDTGTGTKAQDLVWYINDPNRTPLALLQNEKDRAAIENAVTVLWQKGAPLIDRMLVNDGSISSYSLLDYFVYGGNIDKEFQISKYTTKSGAEKTVVGRMAHVGKVQDEISSASEDALFAGIKEAMPRMDGDLLSAVKTINHYLADSQEYLPESAVRALRDYVSQMLIPDIMHMQTAADGSLTQGVFHADRALETLGWHMDMFTSTDLPHTLTPKVRGLLAEEIWSVPSLMTELNQSIMMGTLGRIYTGNNPMQTATWIAQNVDNYPEVKKLMQAAAEAGVTRGNAGARQQSILPPRTAVETQVVAPVENKSNVAQEVADVFNKGDERTLQVDYRPVRGSDVKSKHFTLKFENESGEQMLLVRLEDGPNNTKRIVLKDLKNPDVEVWSGSMPKSKWDADAELGNDEKLYNIFYAKMKDGTLKPKKQAAAAAAPAAPEPAMVAAPAPAAPKEELPTQSPTPSEGVIAAKEAQVENPTTGQAVQGSVTATEEATQTAAAAQNPPGGFSVPREVTPEAKAEIKAFMDTMYADLDIVKVNKGMRSAESNMMHMMLEYQADMKSMMEGYQIKTGRMLRIAGMPILPLPAFTHPMSTYAGIVASVERKGFAVNWIEKLVPEGRQIEFAAKMRRPGKGLDATLNEIRRSTANNAAESVNAVQQIIRETYHKFKSKAQARAEIEDYFVPSKATSEILTDVEERMRMITNHVKYWDNGAPKSAMVTVNNLQVFNKTLPKRWRLPKEIFENTTNPVSGHPPFSRGWFSDVADFLDKSKTYRGHPLARSNINKLDLGQYEQALQQGLLRMKLSNELHRSMFDNFTSAMDPAYVARMNEIFKDVPEDQLIPIEEVFADTLKNFDSTEFKGRYVRAGMATEMAKVTAYMNSRMEYRFGDFDFGMGATINSYWKRNVTVFNVPRYHIANIMADGFLNFIDGVGPKAYGKASIVMGNSSGWARSAGKYADAGIDVERFFRPEMTVDVGNITRDMETLGNPARAKHVTTVVANGKIKVLDSEQIYKAYIDYGLNQTQVKGNINMAMVPAGAGQKSMEKLNAVQNVVIEASSAREDWFRMAHFIHAIESEAKVGGRTLDEIMLAARERVIKYHFDYGDVTEIERIGIARYLPFYKWIRNIVPLAMSELMFNPRAYTMGTYANNAMGQLMFPTQEDMDKEVPLAYVTPDWVGTGGYVPIGTYVDPNGNEQARYAALNLPLDQALSGWIAPLIDPFLDPNQSFGEAASESGRNALVSAGGAGNPLLKSMFAAIGESPTVGGQTMKAGPNDWITNLLGVAFPGGPNAMTFATPLQGPSEKDAEKGRPTTSGAYRADQFGFIRELSATEGTQLGQLRQDEDKLTALLREAQNAYFAKNYPGISPQSEEGKKILKELHKSTGTITR